MVLKGRFMYSWTCRANQRPLIVCFTSYFVFIIAVLPHSPGVVYYHLLLRRETRIPGVAPFSFRTHQGGGGVQVSYTFPLRVTCKKGVGVQM